MCVAWTGDWEVADRDITAYKIVKPTDEDGCFVSPLPVDKRASQHPGGEECGTVLEYRIGATVESDAPGIYCLAEGANPGDAHEVLVVSIPKGAMFRRGKAVLQDTNGHLYDVRTLNALRVRVERIRPKDAPQALWPIAYSTSTSTNTAITGTTWTYFTAGCNTTTTWAAV